MNTMPELVAVIRTVATRTRRAPLAGVHGATNAVIHIPAAASMARCMLSEPVHQRLVLGAATHVIVWQLRLLRLLNVPAMQRRMLARPPAPEAARLTARPAKQLTNTQM